MKELIISKKPLSIFPWINFNHFLSAIHFFSSLLLEGLLYVLELYSIHVANTLVQFVLLW